MRTPRTVLALCLVGMCALLVIAWNPSSQSFNANQFAAANFSIAVKDSAKLTNVVHQITAGHFYQVVYPGGTAAEAFSGSGTYQVFDNLGNALIQYQVGGTSLLIGTNLTVTGSPNSTFGGSVTSITNGFQLNTNAAPGLTLAAGNHYQTNMAAANITLTAFSNVPSTNTWSIYYTADNASGADRSITFPAGCVGSGWGKPVVIWVTNNCSAQFQINGIGQSKTNVSWQPIY